MAKLGKPALAIVIMGVIIAALFVLCTPRTTSKSSTPRVGVRRAAPSHADTARVLVLDFEPIIAASSGRSVRRGRDLRDVYHQRFPGVSRCFFG